MLVRFLARAVCPECKHKSHPHHLAFIHVCKKDSDARGKLLKRKVESSLRAAAASGNVRPSRRSMATCLQHGLSAALSSVTVVASCSQGTARWPHTRLAVADRLPIHGCTLKHTVTFVGALPCAAQAHTRALWPPDTLRPYSASACQG